MLVKKLWPSQHSQLRGGFRGSGYRLHPVNCLVYYTKAGTPLTIVRVQ